ncbi:phenylalanine--tRNA ligase subunit beta [Rickettsia endosymbiont of Halotydeus destructor]|uniref:phenylalanine--tRNA ligase subunit beta n=1 Tax=Rickettsia endosymbiont of Halotydeus destructor TaxID=2996754 RepID=UPI003BAE34D0
MKFTLSWLKQFLDTNYSVLEIANLLTDIGLEVEEIIDKSEELKSFEVAHIISTKPHPSADKLKLCNVQTKNGLVQIVCGASNARDDIKVVLASIGTEIPNGKFKIKESVIRGEKSFGMLCSEEELLLSSESEGIIELPHNAIVGECFTKYYGLDDPIFDIGVTPNRGDALGVYGIARDLAAKGVGTLKDITIPQLTGKYMATTSLEIKDKIACPLFTFREIKNLKNKPSPEWLQKLLHNIKVKPVSAIVDVTNYISYSFGQPMHAYDLDKLKGGISVERVQCSTRLGGYPEKASGHPEFISGSTEIKMLNQVQHDTKSLDSRFRGNDIKEGGDISECLKFQALNNHEYELQAGDLVVKDANGIQGLAGIIGGAASSCTEETTSILLEAACFDAKLIASSGRRLQIDTDARYRFERNIDKAFTLKALDIATDLILLICEKNELLSSEISERVIGGEEKTIPILLDFPVNYLEKITGIKLNINEICDILNKLGFATVINDEVIKITVPSWRHDINILEDIVEEITRIYGYDKLESIKLPAIEQSAIIPKEQKRITIFKRILAAQGYDEVVTNSFMNSNEAKLFSEIKEELFLLNPISVDSNYMRGSILPNLLKIAGKNLTRSIKDVAIFEIGPVFIGVKPEEELTFLSGIKCGSYSLKDAHTLGRAYDVFDIKADLEIIFDYVGLAIDKCKLNAVTLPYFHPTRSTSISLGKNVIGYFGQIHPKILKHFDIDEEILAFELNIMNIPFPKPKFGKKEGFTVSDFQVNFRDYAFVIDENQSVGEVIAYIQGFNKKLIKSVALFDVYTGDKLPSDKKSIAIKVELQADDRTLTEQELNLFSKDLITSVEQKFQAKLRE